MNAKLMQCALNGHVFPEQQGQVFQWFFEITCTRVGPHDIPNQTTRTPGKCCSRCDSIVAAD